MQTLDFAIEAFRLVAMLTILVGLGFLFESIFEKEKFIVDND